MSYQVALKDFKDRRKKETSDMTAEELLSWDVSNEPFGLYFAAKKLWKRTDQRSKDKALDYYKQFVKHPDIAEECSEVKKAIKIVLKAYREGYGTTKTEQLNAAEAFELAIVNKGFSVPKGKGRETEAKRTKKDDNRNMGDWVLKVVTIASIIGPVAKKGIKSVSEFIKSQNSSEKTSKK